MVSSTPRPHFTPGKDPVPILQEAGWASGPVWTGGKSRPHRNSIPDRPARSSVAIPTELPDPHTNNYANLSHDTLFIIQYVYISVCAIVGCLSKNGSSMGGRESFEIQILERIP